MKNAIIKISKKNYKACVEQFKREGLYKVFMEESSHLFGDTDFIFIYIDKEDVSYGTMQSTVQDHIRNGYTMITDLEYLKEITLEQLNNPC